MRSTLALMLTALLGLVAVPATAGPPRSKPATAGPKTPKAPKIAATTAPKARPVTSSPKGPKAVAPKTTGPKAAKSVTSPKSTKAPKAPKAPKTGEALIGKSAVPKNPKLVARLQAMLPPGMTVEQAALGFKNQGQFIAAVNVAQNHGISFVDLKTRMVDGGLSLGQSIQQLKHALHGGVEAARATRRAEQQLEPR
jgi:hypothetical protein